MRNFYCFFLFLTCASLFGQNATNRSDLSIEQIMQGEAFVGYLPTQIRWLPDSKHVLFSWNPEMDTLRSTYQYQLSSNAPERITPEKLKALPEVGAYNSDYTQMIYTKGGELFLYDVAKKQSHRLTFTQAKESNASFSGDDRYLIYEIEDNLYAWDAAQDQVRQLTNFRSGRDRPEPALPKYQQWLETDQLELFDILAERKAEEEVEKRRRKLMELDHPEPFYYGEKRLSGLRASPNLQFITFRLTKPSDSKNTMVPDFVTQSGYLDELRARPKVGSPQPTHEHYIYDRKRDTVYQIDTEQIEGIHDKPDFLREYHAGESPYEDQYEEPREVIIRGPFYAENGRAAVVIRSLDNKDRWIMELIPATGELKLLDRQRDEAWIGGPGIGSYNFSAGNIGWLPDGRLYFQSEVSGYAHLYTVDPDDGKKEALTRGDYEILDVALSRDKSTFFITANKESPFEHHFYHLPVEGGEMRKITSMPGNNDVTVSPDEQTLAIRYSYSNQPWELYVMPNAPGAEARRVTQSTTEAFGAYSWREPEIIYFDANDGVAVPARLYRPEGARPGGPAVIFVHGAGYLQNVHRWWSSYYREYMFHNLLVDNGYTVLDVDYRASNGYGRDWRTAIYRHMGGRDYQDQVDGAAFLVEKLGVDPGRIGIYGGSYGGFITLMALFQSPGTFRAGAALRSVTDWAHYNHGYTSNILNTPVEDSLAYRRSSPIYHAENLEDRLLILHGMVDTNVQFHDVVRLAQRLIELGKDNWEFAVFPVEGHGFVEPSSWADEYKRIFNLFEEELKE